MKVEVKRAFKCYSFFLHQKNKKIERLCLNFCSNPNTSVQQAPQFPNFKIKIMCLLFCFPSFSNNISNTRPVSTKLITNIVVITIESFWIKLNNKSSQISIDHLGLGFISLKTSIYHSCWGKFSNVWCSDYLKMHLRVKKLNLDIFTLAKR